MVTFKIAVTDDKGTVLDTVTVDVRQKDVDDSFRLRNEILSAVGDMNFSRLSNLKGSE